MAQAARRSWVIELDQESGEGYDRNAARQLLLDLESTLYRVGGMVMLTVRRVQTGELAGQPLADSVELVAEWQAYSPLERADDLVEEPVDDVPEPEPDEELEEAPTA